MAAGGIRKKEILRGRKNFKDLFRDGRTVRTRHLKFLVKENGRNADRVAFIAGKRSGNSCFRNYTRRIFREIYRKKKDPLAAASSGNDIAVILVKASFHALSFEERAVEMASGLARIADSKR